MKPVPTATLAQLVNQFREKFEGPNVARTCVLIGAGCSYNSKIPLGGGLVTLLQRETFRKLHVTDAIDWPLEDPRCSEFATPNLNAAGLYPFTEQIDVSLSR